MPIIKFPSIRDEPTLDDVVDYIERMRKELQWALDKNLDTKNAREFAGWLIRPDKIVSVDGDVGMSTLDTGTDDIRFFAGPDGSGGFLFYVTKGGLLVAQNASIQGVIEALSGHVGGFTIENDRLSSDSGDGIIEGGTIIGAYITTADGTYPRVDLSTTGNIFQAFQDATSYIGIDPDVTSEPALLFKNSSTAANVGTLSGLMWFNVITGILRLSSNSDVQISAGGKVIFDSWSNIQNDSSGQTLQQEFDALEAQIDSKQDEFISTDIIIIGGVATLSATGVGAGTYTKLTVNAEGRATAGTTLSSSDIPSLAQSKITNLTTDLAAKSNAVIKQGTATTGVESSTGSGIFYASATITYSGFASAPKVHATSTYSVASWVSAITPISSTSATIYLSSTQTGFVAGKVIDWTAILA